MKKILPVVAIVIFGGQAIAQNVGINNTDPKAALDINGGLRLRPVNTLVSGTSVALNSTTGHHFITGSPTGNFTIAFTPTVESGQHTIITNNTAFIGNIFAIQIKPQTTVELFFSNGEWKQIGSSEAIGTTAWSRTGNGGTIDGVNNIFGTTDAKPIRFIENSLPSGIMDASKGSYFFGGSAGADQQASAIGNSGYGYLAMQKNTTGSANTAVGCQSMQINLKGGFSVAMGFRALANDTLAEQTVAVGAQSLFWNNNRFGNTAVGTNSLYNNTNPDLAVIAATQGLHNTALGYNAFFSNRSGSGVVGIGYNAAFSSTKSSGIIAIGRAAMYNYNGITANFAIGDSAMFNLTGGGGSNTAIGHRALFATVSAQSNTAIGSASLTNNLASYNTATGSVSLFRNTVGDFNTANGYAALLNNIDGRDNNAFGAYALRYNTEGTSNTVVGNEAANFNTTGSYNVAVGNVALYSNISGDYNTTIGNRSMLSHETGDYNVALGYNALANNVTGAYNVALGYGAGFNEATSNKLYIENSIANKDNAFIYGDFSADSLLLNTKTINKFSLNVRGSNALEIGYGTAGKQTDAGKICYGCFGDPAHWFGIVGGGIASDGNDRVLKLWSEGGLRIKGNALPDFNNAYSLGTSTQRWKEVWTNAGTINTSDANLKTNIATSPYGLYEVMQMNPVQYNWKTNPTEDLQIGFLAQDIQKIIPEAVVVPANGDPLGMKYTELIPVLVKGMQEQQKIIESQQKQIDEMYKLLKAKK